MMSSAINLTEMSNSLLEVECYFNNNVLPQIYVDSQLVLRKMTVSAQRAFGLDSADEGKYVTALRLQFRSVDMVQEIIMVMEHGKSVEKDLQSSDDTWYQMKITSYFNASNNPDGVLITFIDITEKVHRLRLLEAQLRQNETVLDTISHDIRSPLTNLILAVDLFATLKPEDFDQARNSAKLISRSIRRMERVIRDLTESRRSAASPSGDGSLVDIALVVEDVYLSLHQDILDSNATFEYNYQLSHLLYSRPKLRSILFNLVSNAIKYRHCSRAPRIRIAARADGKYVVLSVTDNGTGIHPDHQSRVFEKYYRSSHTADGTGLGLYIVKQVIEQDGGKIILISNPGHGSEFRAYLPISQFF